MTKNSKKNKIKISELEQTDGKLIEKDLADSKLDILLGADGMGRYGTLNKEDYQKKIENFNTAELRNHAIYAGLIPIPDVNRLKKQLLIEFDKYVLAFKTPTKFKTNKMPKEKEEEALKIMSMLRK